ncbi:MAG: hypothetical protein SWE60_07945 [Thermodesulfobacteriota bacterium]|nr:hypothetical protein [Thermodesulfobacteriota bacterium]
MITISQYPPIAPDYANQVGVAQLQEKQDEQKKVTIQDSKESEKLRFQKEKDKQEEKKKRRPQQEEAQALGEDDSQSPPKRLLDVTV